MIDKKYISSIALGIAIAIVMIYLFSVLREPYVSRREKAETIASWWKSDAPKSYENYKSAVSGSDIVEYSNVKKISKSGGNVSADVVEGVIS
jgi:hypothetical protein